MKQCTVAGTQEHPDLPIDELRELIFHSIGEHPLSLKTYGNFALMLWVKHVRLCSQWSWTAHKAATFHALLSHPYMYTCISINITQTTYIHCIQMEDGAAGYNFALMLAVPSHNADFSMTFGTTFLRWKIYFLNFAMPTVATIAATSSSFVWGLASGRIYSFSSCHIFSMGLFSGDLGHVFHHFTSFSCLQTCVRCATCMCRITVLHEEIRFMFHLRCPHQVPSSWCH